MNKYYLLFFSVTRIDFKFSKRRLSQRFSPKENYLVMDSIFIMKDLTEE